MVIVPISSKRRERGMLTTEMIVVMGILVAVVIPISCMYWTEAKLARRYYQDAVAMELLDGETELLAAGEWKSYGDGAHEVHPVGAAVTNLPPGKFMVTRTATKLRVEWQPEKRGRKMARELKLQ